MTKYKVGDIVVILPITEKILDAEGPELSEEESKAPHPNPILIEVMREWIGCECVVISTDKNFFHLKPLGYTEDEVEDTYDTSIWWADWQVSSRVIKNSASLMKTE